jgi:hypothetical protein
LTWRVRNSLLLKSAGWINTAAGDGAVDLSVDGTADEEGQSGDVEPDEEDHHRAERAVGGAVAFGNAATPKRELGVA